MPAPMARQASGRRIRYGLNLTGRSTNLTVKAASPSDAVANATRVGRLSGPHAASASLRQGQCQRYQAYDIRPNHWSGRTERTASGPAVGSAAPATNIAAVPSTGTVAA